MIYAVAALLLVAAYVATQQPTDPAAPGSSSSGDPVVDFAAPFAIEAATGIAGIGIAIDATQAVADEVKQTPDFIGEQFGNLFGGIEDTVSSVIDTGKNAVIATIANVIQQHEGWFPGSRSQRNFNPGNLRVDGDLIPRRDSGGFGRFSSYGVGRAALESDIRAKLRKYPTYSIYDMIARYAPPIENDTTTYANVVAGALGVPVTTQLKDLSA